METHMIFETHAHYDDEKFKEDREQLVSSLPEQNIRRVINWTYCKCMCIDRESESDRRTDGKISLCLWRLWNSPG